ncbi:hypothetical protein ACFY12_08400 [Streptomyces sp. NPDC001339]
MSELVPLLAFGVLSAWFWVLPALGWFFALGFAVDANTVQGREGAAR